MNTSEPPTSTGPHAARVDERAQLDEHGPASTSRKRPRGEVPATVTRTRPAGPLARRQTVWQRRAAPTAGEGRSRISRGPRAERRQHGPARPFARGTAPLLRASRSRWRPRRRARRRRRALHPRAAVRGTESGASFLSSITPPRRGGADRGAADPFTGKGNHSGRSFPAERRSGFVVHATKTVVSRGDRRAEPRSRREPSKDVERAPRSPAPPPQGGFSKADPGRSDRYTVPDRANRLCLQERRRARGHRREPRPWDSCRRKRLSLIHISEPTRPY